MSYFYRGEIQGNYEEIMLNLRRGQPHIWVDLLRLVFFGHPEGGECAEVKLTKYNDFTNDTPKTWY